MGVYGGFHWLSENRIGSFSWWGSVSSLDRTDGDLQDFCCWTQWVDGYSWMSEEGREGGIPLPVLIWTKPPHPSLWVSPLLLLRLQASPASRSQSERSVEGWPTAPWTAWSELWGAGWSGSDASCSAPPGGEAAGKDPSCREGRGLRRC